MPSSSPRPLLLVAVAAAAVAVALVGDLVSAQSCSNPGQFNNYMCEWIGNTCCLGTYCCPAFTCTCGDHARCSSSGCGGSCSSMTPTTYQCSGNCNGAGDPTKRVCGGRCGVADDGCFGTINCPACTNDRVCVNENCVCPAVPASACTGKCGTIMNGCGNSRNCGGCGPDQTCGLTTPNVCGCNAVPSSACSGKCGTITNACNNNRNCGGCGADQTCGLTTANVCGCNAVPSSACTGKCGTVSNACNNNRNCGGCGADQTCGLTTVNVCGCDSVPSSACTGMCGTITNACNNNRNCGGCSANFTCGLTSPNICGCDPPPSSACDPPSVCGVLSSSCGATRDCGTGCGADELCINTTCTCEAIDCRTRVVSNVTVVVGNATVNTTVVNDTRYCGVRRNACGQRDCDAGQNPPVCGPGETCDLFTNRCVCPSPFCLAGDCGVKTSPCSNVTVDCGATCASDEICEANRCVDASPERVVSVSPPPAPASFDFVETGLPIILWSLGGCCVLFLVVAAIMWRRRRSKQRLESDASIDMDVRQTTPEFPYHNASDALGPGGDLQPPAANKDEDGEVYHNAAAAGTIGRVGTLGGEQVYHNAKEADAAAVVGGAAVYHDATTAGAEEEPYQSLRSLIPSVAASGAASQAATGRHPLPTVLAAPGMKELLDEVELLEAHKLRRGRQLGAGEYGVVYEGTYDGEEVAIKEIKDCVDEEALSEFISEAGVMAKLPVHNNVVRFLGLVAVTRLGTPAIITEICRGDSLRKLLDREALLGDPLLNMAWGIAVGVQFLHQAGIIHRDIAARNILLDDEWTPKLCDLGLARITTDAAQQRQTRQNHGPVKWMAPEALVHRQYSSASDVWMWAATVVEIITRDDPFPGQTAVDAATMVASGRAVPTPPADKTPPALASLLPRCFERDPAQRATIDEVVQHLDF